MKESQLLAEYRTLPDEQFPYMFKPKTCSNPICNKVFPYITAILSSLQFVKLQNYMFKPKTLLPKKTKKLIPIK